MKARDVVDRTIVAIEQQQVRLAGRGRACFHLDAILLNDGTRILFNAVEQDNGNGPLVEATVWKGPPEMTGTDAIRSLPTCAKECVHSVNAKRRRGVLRWECFQMLMVRAGRGDFRCGRDGGPRIEKER